MAVTPFLNNAATVLVMAPIAATFATDLGLAPEAFLMAVAIGAGSDFLTPIGHQCNTLVMGPGGYRFGDYWRLGLPLSILVIVITVPLLQIVWPMTLATAGPRAPILSRLRGRGTSEAGGGGGYGGHSAAAAVSSLRKQGPTS